MSEAKECTPLRRAIAIDFDGCLCKPGAWPGIGAPNWRVIEAALKERADGASDSGDDRARSMPFDTDMTDCNGRRIKAGDIVRVAGQDALFVVGADVQVWVIEKALRDRTYEVRDGAALEVLRDSEADGYV